MAAFRSHRGKVQAIIRRKGWRPITKTFATKSEARAWARRIEARIDEGARGEAVLVLPAGRASRPGSASFGDICRRYRDEVAPRNKGGDVEVWRIGAFLRRKGEGGTEGSAPRVPLHAVDFHALSPGAIAAYRDERLGEVSSGTVRTELELLQRIWQRAAREWGLGLQGPSPFAQVRKPPKARARDRRMLGDEQARIERAITQGMRRCRNPYIEPLFLVALETSCRRSELLRLRWDRVRIEGDGDKPIGTALLLDTKNGEDREIGLSTRAIEVLRALRARQEQEARQRNEPPPVLCFPVSPEAVKCAWRRLRKRAGSDGQGSSAPGSQGSSASRSASALRFHDLRHEAISRFFEEKGLSVPEAALMSGHKDYRMLARYTHMRAREVAGKLD